MLFCYSSITRKIIRFCVIYKNKFNIDVRYFPSDKLPHFKLVVG